LAQEQEPRRRCGAGGRWAMLRNLRKRNCSKPR
jgi:hypothetical protein